MTEKLRVDLTIKRKCIKCKKDILWEELKYNNKTSPIEKKLPMEVLIAMWNNTFNFSFFCCSCLKEVEANKDKPFEIEHRLFHKSLLIKQTSTKRDHMLFSKKQKTKYLILHELTEEK